MPIVQRWWVTSTIFHCTCYSIHRVIPSCLQHWNAWRCFRYPGLTKWVKSSTSSLAVCQTLAKISPYISLWTDYERELVHPLGPLWRWLCSISQCIYGQLCSRLRLHRGRMAVPANLSSCRSAGLSTVISSVQALPFVTFKLCLRVASPLFSIRQPAIGLLD